MSDVCARALAAYYRKDGSALSEPPASSELRLGGKSYVLVKCGTRLLAVYRVLNHGPLKRLRRWPKQIEIDEDEHRDEKKRG